MNGIGSAYEVLSQERVNRMNWVAPVVITPISMIDSLID